MRRDPILIALAQNGLFRLQCGKATIWSVDGLSQHVVAEAGPLSALCSPQQPSSHETSLNQLIKESLHVFTTATTPTDDTSDTIVNHTRHVIRDVSSRESLKFTSSVVTSYAAVPILGACGQLLGCYCVTDEDIRDDYFPPNRPIPYLTTSPVPFPNILDNRPPPRVCLVVAATAQLLSSMTLLHCRPSHLKDLSSLALPVTTRLL